LIRRNLHAAGLQLFLEDVIQMGKLRSIERRYILLREAHDASVNGGGHFAGEGARGVFERVGRRCGVSEEKRRKEKETGAESEECQERGANLTVEHGDARK